MSVLRIGDMVRERFGHDNILLLGHYLGPSGSADAWSGLYFPTHPDLGDPFVGAYPYDFAEQDASRPGALMPADPWSTWTT